MSSLSSHSILRLGTRASLLARTQSQQVADALQRQHRGLKVELVLVKTSGDQITDRALHEFGGKGLFTRELETALLQERIDLAVHSLKDVPVTMPLVDVSDLMLVAIPRREDPRDVLVGPRAMTISELPEGARVGTGSLRRRAQLLQRRPDLVIQPIRGNIDTRLRRLHEGSFDAIVLAKAGISRCGLFDQATMSAIEPEEMLPAAAQGALALQCRRNDERTRRLAEVLNDPTAFLCAQLEREVVQALGGDCHSPIAALAEVAEGQVRLRAAVAARGGVPPVVSAQDRAPRQDAPKALESVMQSLRDQGAFELLAGEHAGDYR